MLSVSNLAVHLARQLRLWLSRQQQKTLHVSMRQPRQSLAEPIVTDRDASPKIQLRRRGAWVRVVVGFVGGKDLLRFM